MRYAMIGIYLAIALLFFCLAFWGRPLSQGNTLPSEERKYWEELTKKFRTGYFAASAGGLFTALALILLRPLLAEIGCITVLASIVFPLAILSKKTAFKPSPITQQLQKRYKTILLVISFATLLFTQQVFQLFITQ